MTQQRSAPALRPAPVLRRARRVLVALALVGLLALGAAWATTPGVDDARARVDARLAAHAGTALGGDVPPRGTDPDPPTDPIDELSFVPLRQTTRNRRGGQ